MGETRILKLSRKMIGRKSKANWLNLKSLGSSYGRVSTDSGIRALLKKLARQAKYHLNEIKIFSLKDKLARLLWQSDCRNATSLTRAKRNKSLEHVAWMHLHTFASHPSSQTSPLQAYSRSALWIIRFRLVVSFKKFAQSVMKLLRKPRISKLRLSGMSYSSLLS